MALEAAEAGLASEAAETVLASEAAESSDSHASNL